MGGDILQDRYLILSLLGRGGMGSVYLAKDLRLNGKQWAIKEVKTTMEQQMFLDEAHMLSGLSHPSLPHIIDFYPPDKDGYSYLVMDYIQGKTLHQEFEDDQRQFTTDRVVQISIQITELLTYLHTQQPPVIFRDLKPSNIMLNGETVKLIDFGTARWYQHGKKEDTIPLGTVGFAAPEQFEGNQSDPRTDIYSLGAMMYYLLTQGQYIHQQDNRTTLTLNRLMSGTLNKSKLASIIKKATRTNPENRYQSASEMQEELQSCVDDLHLRLHDQNQTLAPVQTFNMPTKCILIGSLWPGAGSTTLTMNMARHFARQGIRVAYVEHPQISPYMFDYLNIAYKEEVVSDPQVLHIHHIDHHATRKDKGMSDETVLRRWEEDGVVWGMRDPRQSYNDTWTKDDFFQTLFLYKDVSIILIDISTLWLSDGVDAFLPFTDHVYLCVEPDPVKVDRLASPDTTENRIYHHLLERDSKEDINLELITMKMAHTVPLKEWKNCFVKQPNTYIPYVPYPVIARASWRSEFIIDDKDYGSVMEEALQDISEKFIPDTILASTQKSQSSISFSKLKQWFQWARSN
nr:serine/threonine-protein kinase [Caldalkalibacillus salinus]